MEAASKNGRSLSEEVEQCVEHYYDNADNYGELARLIGTVVRALETAERNPWMTNHEMRVKTRAAIDAVLDILVTKTQDPVALQQEAQQEIIKAERYNPTHENKLLMGSKPDFEAIHRKLNEVHWISATQLKTANILRDELYKSLPQRRYRIQTLARSSPHISIGKVILTRTSHEGSHSRTLARQVGNHPRYSKPLEIRGNGDAAGTPSPAPRRQAQIECARLVSDSRRNRRRAVSAYCGVLPRQMVGAHQAAGLAQNFRAVFINRSREHQASPWVDPFGEITADLGERCLQFCAG